MLVKCPLTRRIKDTSLIRLVRWQQIEDRTMGMNEESSRLFLDAVVATLRQLGDVEPDSRTPEWFVQERLEDVGNLNAGDADVWL